MTTTNLNWTEAGTGTSKTFTATADVNGTAVAFEVVKTGGGRFRLLVDGEKTGADSPKHAVKKDEAEEIVKERLAAVPPAPVPEPAPEAAAEAVPAVAPEVVQEVETAPAPVELPVTAETMPEATPVAVEAVLTPVPAAPAPVALKAKPAGDGWTKKRIKQPTTSPCGKASVVELDDAGKQWKATVSGVEHETVFKTMSAAKAFATAELEKLPALSH